MVSCVLVRAAVEGSATRVSNCDEDAPETNRRGVNSSPRGMNGLLWCRAGANQPDRSACDGSLSIGGRVYTRASPAWLALLTYLTYRGLLSVREEDAVIRHVNDTVVFERCYRHVTRLLHEAV